MHGAHSVLVCLLGAYFLGRCDLKRMGRKDVVTTWLLKFIVLFKWLFVAILYADEPLFFSFSALES